MRLKQIRLDARRRRVTVGDRCATLQERSWQVLTMLIAHAPMIVSRRQIIDELWQGNHLTGEKGLNQAMWAIRRALNDDAREPCFVHTVPRIGYRWIYPKPVDRTSTGLSLLQHQLTSVAAGIILGIMGMAIWSPQTQSSIAGFTPIEARSKSVATRAYLVDRDIHVEFASGRHGVLRNRTNARPGEPVLSADRASIAITLRDDGKCRLVTVDVFDGNRQDFEACPDEVI